MLVELSVMEQRYQALLAVVQGRWKGVALTLEDTLEPMASADRRFHYRGYRVEKAQAGWDIWLNTLARALLMISAFGFETTPRAPGRSPPAPSLADSYPLPPGRRSSGRMASNSS